MPHRAQAPAVRRRPTESPTLAYRIADRSQIALFEDLGFDATPVNERWLSEEQLVSVFDKMLAIAQVMDRSPDSARQLASRARRRVQAAPQPDRDIALQRRRVDAFLAAARAGDFEALVQVLDPDVVFRADPGPASQLAHPPLAGAGTVARRVLSTAPRFVNLARPVLVNGEAGALFGTHDDPIAVIGFTVVGGRVAELNLVADPAKLRHLTIEP